jgi:ribosome-binding protein aMBF1 (putative translation factor)
MKKCEACGERTQGYLLSRKELDDNKWLEVCERCYDMPRKDYRKMLINRVKEAKAAGKDLTDKLGGKKKEKENEVEKVEV